MLPHGEIEKRTAFSRKTTALYCGWIRTGKAGAFVTRTEGSSEWPDFLIDPSFLASGDVPYMRFPFFVKMRTTQIYRPFQKFTQWQCGTDMVPRTPTESISI